MKSSGADLGEIYTKSSNEFRIRLKRRGKLVIQRLTITRCLCDNDHDNSGRNFYAELSRGVFERIGDLAGSWTKIEIHVINFLQHWRKSLVTPFCLSAPARSKLSQQIRRNVQLHSATVQTE